MLSAMNRCSKYRNILGCINGLFYVKIRSKYKPFYFASSIYLVQVRLRTEVPSTPSSTQPEFELMNSRSHVSLQTKKYTCLLTHTALLCMVPIICFYMCPHIQSLCINQNIFSLFTKHITKSCL